MRIRCNFYPKIIINKLSAYFIILKITLSSAYPNIKYNAIDIWHEI